MKGMTPEDKLLAFFIAFLVIGASLAALGWVTHGDIVNWFKSAILYFFPTSPAAQLP
jgi:hypothetical protein